MHIKKTTLWIIALCIFSNSTFFSANTKVVTINGQRLMTTSKPGQSINEKLMKEKDALSKPLQEEEKSIVKKEQDLKSRKKDLDKEAEEASKSPLLNAEAKQRKFEELQDKAQQLEEDGRELERMIKKFQAGAKKVEARLSQMYQEEMGKFDSMIKDTIKTLADKEGWDVVLMEEQVLFSVPSVSKTDVVVKELDNKHQSSNTNANQLEKEIKEDEKLIKKLQHGK